MRTWRGWEARVWRQISRKTLGVKGVRRNKPGRYGGRGVGLGGNEARVDLHANIHMCLTTLSHFSSPDELTGPSREGESLVFKAHPVRGTSTKLTLKRLQSGIKSSENDFISTFLTSRTKIAHHLTHIHNILTFSMLELFTLCLDVLNSYCTTLSLAQTPKPVKTELQKHIFNIQSSQPSIQT